MPIDPRETRERRARIEQMFEEYREARQRRLMQRAIKLWRRTEAHQLVVKLESQPERVH